MHKAGIYGFLLPEDPGEVSLDSARDLGTQRWESFQVLDPRREGSYVWSRIGHDRVRCSVV